MHKLIAIVLALAFVGTAHAAEGRRTAFVSGVVVGAVGGYLVRDAMEVRPTREVVVVRESPTVVREVVVVREAPTPPPVRVIVIDGRTYTVRESGSVIVYTNSNGGWTPPPAFRPLGIEN